MEIRIDSAPLRAFVGEVSPALRRSADFSGRGGECRRRPGNRRSLRHKITYKPASAQADFGVTRQEVFDLKGRKWWTHLGSNQGPAD